MTLLAMIDHDGVTFSFGARRHGVDPAGLVLAADLAAGARVDRDGVAAIAERYSSSDTDGLADLGATIEATIGGRPVDAPGLFAPRPTRHRSPLASVDNDDSMVQVSVPFPLVLSSRGYVAWAPTGTDPVVLDAEEVAVLATFAMPRRPSTVDAALLPGNSLAADVGRLDRFVADRLRDGLLQRSLSFKPRKANIGGDSTLSSINERTKTLLARQAEILAARPPRAGRVPVFPVNRSVRIGPPLALGLLLAYAEAFDGGRLTETYDFVPDWTIRAKAVKRLTRSGPGIFLFSDYIWSSDENLVVSEEVRRVSPESLIVHGGPNAPKYPEDRDRYFAEHPEVDVLVHGEGEATVAEMLDVLGGRWDDLSVLGSVAGLSYRPAPGAAPVTTGDRDRITDLDSIPSPYLSGMFDAFLGCTELMILETNRGCPYGCTFCDWGSATMSRIRKFGMDRVQGEVDWAGRAGAKVIVVGDANFGIFGRDVEVAEALVLSKATHGAPEQVVFSYAKNTVKHVEQIVRTMVDGGIFGQAAISIQSFDEATLNVINRRNIRTAKYDDLTRTFRQSKLPVYTDLMIGLPGSTVDSVSRDLQRCVERDVMVRSYATQLLTNSPMNAPEYRAEHQIVVDDRDILISTSTYTEADRREMDRRIDQFHAAESYGTLRQILRWIAHERAVPEVTALEAIADHARADAERFPLTVWLLGTFLQNSVPPGSWTLFYDEVEAIVRDLWADLTDDPGWASVRAAQHALMPDRGRVFPARFELDHDVVAWSWAITDARTSGGTMDSVPPLRDHGPGELVIDDPNRVCEEQLGAWHFSADFHYWELGSPLARHLGGRWAPAR